MSQREIKTAWAKTNWREKSIADLQAEIRKVKTHSFDLRLDRATGKLNNFRDVLLTRKRVALLQTLIREKQLASGKESK
jgi:ribosomal protein L29